MLFQRRLLKHLVTIVVVLLCGSTGGAQTRVSGTTHVWVARLASTYFDARSVSEITIAHAGDQQGMTYLLKSLPTALATRYQRIGPIDQVEFVTRYRPIWKGDKVVAPEWDQRAARIKHLRDDVIKPWAPALEAARGNLSAEAWWFLISTDSLGASAVLETWIIGFLIDTDSLFTESGLDARRSGLLLGRLKSLPKAVVESLAKALNIGGAWAAVLLVQNDDLFDPSGTFREAQFESAMKLLAARTAPGK